MENSSGYTRLLLIMAHSTQSLKGKRNKCILWYPLLKCVSGTLNLFIILFSLCPLSLWTMIWHQFLFISKVYTFSSCNLFACHSHKLFKTNTLHPFPHPSSSLILQFWSKPLRVLILWESKHRGNPLRGCKRWAIVEVGEEVSSTVLSVSDP